MLSRLRHRPIRRRNHQHRSIHLRSSRDHVLDIIRMTRTIHVRIVAVLGLILHMRRCYRYPSCLLLRRLIYLIKRNILRHLLRLLAQRNCRSQCRLAMINMPYRTHIHVRLRTFILLLSLSHRSLPILLHHNFLRVRYGVPSFRTRISHQGWLQFEVLGKMEPTTRIELVTTRLPCVCSTN